MRLQDAWSRAGRLAFPLPLFAYPFYLFARSPGKEGSHYDPKCDLFKPSEKNMVLTSNACMLGVLAVLGALTFKLGPVAVFCLYVVPYWINVVWLDIVTYLHHHGSSDREEQMPWYRCASLVYSDSVAVLVAAALERKAMQLVFWRMLGTAMRPAYRTICTCVCNIVLGLVDALYQHCSCLCISFAPTARSLMRICAHLIDAA